MPEEPLENESQPSTTPNFDNFSGRNDEANEQLTQTSPFVDDESAASPLIQTQDTTSIISQEQTINPSSSFAAEPEENPFSTQTTNQTETTFQSESQAQQPAQPFESTPVVTPVPVANPIDSNSIDQPAITNTKTGGFNNLLKNKKLVIGIVIGVVIFLVGGILFFTI